MSEGQLIEFPGEFAPSAFRRAAESSASAVGTVLRGGRVRANGAGVKARGYNYLRRRAVTERFEKVR